MTRVNMSPAEVRQVARRLKTRASEVQSIVSGLRGDMNALESAWQDDGFTRFKGTIEQTINQLATFKQAAEEQAAFLQKKTGAYEAAKAG